MPRSVRSKSTTDIYHAMLRGINHQQIFNDKEDYEKFISILQDCKNLSGFKLYAYCLMGNHIHLLLKTEAEDLSQIFKRIGTRYASWYNRKYNRIGHLFQDRYKSEPVEDDGYFTTVLCYIHQNPVKAGLTKTAKSYKYSSYSDYVGVSKITDTAFALSLIGEKEFVNLHKKEFVIFCFDEKPSRLNDEDARELMYKLVKCRAVEDFQKLNNTERDTSIKKLKIAGMTIRQINRLTGVSKGIVERV